MLLLALTLLSLFSFSTYSLDLSPCGPLSDRTHYVGETTILMADQEVKAAVCPFLESRKRADFNDYLNHQYYDVQILEQGEWNEISTIGNLSFCSDADDTPPQPVDLGFTFSFFGHPQNSLLISPNGFLALDLQVTCPDYSFCGWGQTNYLRFIAPFMTDFDPSLYVSSRIYFAKGVDSQKRKTFTVQFDNLYLWNHTFDPDVDGYTFQVVINSDSEIRFNYKNIAGNPLQIQNDDFNRKYPLDIGVLDSVFLNYDGFYIASPYKPVSIDVEQLKNGSSVILTALPTCLDFNDCNSCATKSEKKTGLACGWCEGAKICTDGVGREVNQILSACPSPDHLIKKGTQCRNYPGKIAGIVIGAILGVLLLILVGFIIYRRFKKYIASIEGRLGGKKGDELPQLDQEGNPQLKEGREIGMGEPKKGLDA